MLLSYPYDLAAPGAVDALLDFHRALFGSSRMETEQVTDDGEQETDQLKPELERRSDSDDGLGDAGRRALAAERKAARDEKRRADEAVRQLDELRRKEMSDAERVAAERDDWRKKFEEQTAIVAARDLDLLRRDVAGEKGLNPTLARRLQGTTREELEADADDLRSQIGPAVPEPSIPKTPKPDRSAGSAGANGRPTTVADAMRDLRARQASTGPST